MPGLSSYLAALRDPVARWELLKMGVYYALVVGVLVTLWSFVSPEGAGPSQMAPTPPPTAQAPGAPTAPANPPAAPEPAEQQVPDLSLTPLRAVMLVASALVLVPLQMTVWFAPVLVAWHRMPASKALFFSFFACWRNRAPMLVYLLALFGLACMAVLAFAALIGLLNAKGGLAQLLLAPPPLLVLAIAQTSTLAMYRDVVASGSDLRNQQVLPQQPGPAA